MSQYCVGMFRMQTDRKLKACFHSCLSKFVLSHIMSVKVCSFTYKAISFYISLTFCISHLYITLAWHIQLFGLTTLRINCAYAVIQKSLRLPLGLRIHFQTFEGCIYICFIFFKGLLFSSHVLKTIPEIFYWLVSILTSIHEQDVCWDNIL